MRNVTERIEAGQDVIDVRDIIERIEEIEPLRDAVEEAKTERADLANASPEEIEAADQAIEAAELEFDDDAQEELAMLLSLMEDLKGNGGDEQWRGDWYPITIINESYFNTAMDDLLEDIGDLPKNLPSYLKIEVDYDALQLDYISTEYGGFTYWYR